MNNRDDEIRITLPQVYDKLLAVERKLDEVLRTHVSWKALGAIAALVVPAVGVLVAIWP